MMDCYELPTFWFLCKIRVVTLIKSYNQYGWLRLSLETYNWVYDFVFQGKGESFSPKVKAHPVPEQEKA